MRFSNSCEALPCQLRLNLILKLQISFLDAYNEEHALPLFRGHRNERLVSMLITGTVVANDSTYASDMLGEDEVIELLKRKAWDQLAGYSISLPELTPLKAERRRGLRSIDAARAKLTLGDSG